MDLLAKSTPLQNRNTTERKCMEVTNHEHIHVKLHQQDFVYFLFVCVSPAIRLLQQMNKYAYSNTLRMQIMFMY